MTGASELPPEPPPPPSRRTLAPATVDTADVRAVTYWWPAVDHGGELSPFPMANAVLRRWRLFVILPLLLALALVVPRFFAPRVYESTASFTPQAGGVPRGAISGLAAQFGLSVPAGEATQSPAC